MILPAMRPFLPMLLCLCGIASAQKIKVEELYAKNCSGCHGAKFEGGQGGSLVDGVWKHGSTDAEISKSIAKGNLQLGMTPWEGVLSGDQIRSLVIFLREKEKQTLVKGMDFPKPSPDTVTKTELHDYRIETLVEGGLKNPWAIAFLPDGRKLVTEKSGQLRFITGDGKLDPEIIAGTPPVIEHGQGGLMEVAVHPDYAKNGWVYLGLSDGTREKREGGKDEVHCLTAVVRGKIKGHRWTQQEWIYRPDPKFRSGAGVHFGTRFVFDKGYIYFVIGERGGDELNLILPGRNYGWPVVTLGMNYDGMPMSYAGPDGKTILSVTEKEGIEQPVAYWLPSIAVCGLDFYTGDKFPKWKNDLLVGALAQQEIRRLRIVDKKVVSQEIILKDIGRVRDVAMGPDGLIYVVLNGPDRLARLVPAGK